MPRNSSDNSLARFYEIQEIAKVYHLKDRYNRRRRKELSAYALYNLKKINKIERVWKVLSDPYRTIIKNTFFSNKDCYWWVDFYSKTTFYRLRSKAISSFLMVYKNL